MATKMFTHTPLFIDNTFVAPRNPSSKIDVIDAATENVIATLPEASAADVDSAFDAADRAFPEWSKLGGAARAKYMLKIAEAVKKQSNYDQLALLESHMGKPLAESKWDVDDVAYCFEYYATKATELDGKQGTPVPLPDEDYKCELRYDAMGVAACIVPWNYPLLMATWKLAPALAAGCTVVIKPSEFTPLTLLLLMKIINDEAPLPPGVINVVIGTGRVGQMMASHPRADKVAFTGSEATGSKVMATAAPSIKNVSLELGGKSAIIVFDDASLDIAVEWVMFGCFWTNGQICSATSRLLIHKPLEAAFLARLVECAKAIPIINPLDPAQAEATGALGPLVAKRQLDTVSRLVNEACKDNHATLLTGGRRPPSMPNGYFYEPTVLHLTPKANGKYPEIWTTEVFGPVLSVVTFETEAEAVRLANGTSFGLAAAVLSADGPRCRRVAAALQAGIVWVQCSQPAFCDAPWGGFKRSGIGRELGEAGLYNYLEMKQVTTYVAGDKPLGWYALPPRSKL